MFEDKSSNSDNLGRNRFFMPDDNPTGLNTGNDNLNFSSNNCFVCSRNLFWSNGYFYFAL